MARDSLLAHLRTELVDAEAYAADLREMIKKLSDRSNRPGAPSGTTSPLRASRTASEDTRVLALRVINEAPERAWTITALAQEMQSQGWATTSNDPINALRAAISRLYNSEQIERRGSGLYGAVRPSQDDEPSDTPVTTSPVWQDMNRAAAQVGANLLPKGTPFRT